MGSFKHIRVLHAKLHVRNQHHERMGGIPYMPYDQAIRDLQKRVQAIEKLNNTNKTNVHGHPPPYSEQRNDS